MSSAVMYLERGNKMRKWERDEMMASLCDNASYKRSYPIITPQCYSNKATRQVTISYNEVESDSLSVCDACAKALRRDCRGRGYRFSSRKV